jgi:predicted membrane protein
LKLPVWRLITALAVLGVMAAILIALTPVYFENYQLRSYVTDLVHSPNALATPDETLRSRVLAEARQLDLPVRSDDIRITHADGKVEVQMKYAVQMDFPLYQVDLHFHPTARSQ